MNTFSFVIHPLELKRDAARYKPILGIFPEPVIEQIALRMGPKTISQIKGITSKTGAQCEGFFVGCPLGTRQLLNLPHEVIYKKLVDAGKYSADLGAKIMGLGAFTSVAGDAGVTVAQRLEGIIGVTSGNSYTVYSAIQALLLGAQKMEIEARSATVAIVGATGSIGAVSAKILASQVGEIILLGRDMAKLEKLKVEVEAQSDCSAQIRVSTDIRAALREAELVLTVSSAGKELIFPEDLKVGAVICDVARPRDVSKAVVEKRDDVLVIEGGVITVPGEDVQFNFEFGFPRSTAFACMSETMLMALEGTNQNYTLGRDLSVEQVKRIGEIAKKHGFELAGFRSFEIAVTDEHIEQVRQNARRKRALVTA
ncbi:putative amino acid dehydrogenase [Abditibacterium utsteinense]|uniref:Putative amino acid dehydrogenase n=1 Tax=Abditibacterium utsteinense TaxID=1960156 RepID=A0A2S8SXG4_9BACT|nr:shikimate dehydrogenase [Abditibacterium utsteinense]PQV65493.1 putative amino acid dehydrogenase [Abditibacterium utsteinense]